MGKCIALCVAVFGIAGCGGGSSPNTPDGGGGGDGGGSDGQVTSGLTIHLGREYIGREPGTLHVLLGDGTQQIAAPDSSGNVRFEDATLPTDVTLVNDDLYSTFVFTIAGVDRNEIWFDLTEDPDRTCPCVDATIRGTVTGTITQGVNAYAVNDQQIVAANDASFSLDLHRPGVALSVYDLLAYDGQGGRAVNVGLRRNVSAPAGMTIEGQDIALDHPFDQSFAITPENDAATGGAYRARLRFSMHDQVTFGTDTSTFPAVVASPVMDAALDGLDRRAEILSGDNDENDWQRTDPASFFASTIQPVAPSETSATVRTLDPAAITAPAVGTWDAPGTASRDSLALTWTHDASAPLVELRLATPAQMTTTIFWRVMVPSARGGFTFFPLPASVSRNAAFPTGPHRIALTQYGSGQLVDAIAPWSAPHEYWEPPTRALTTQWSMVTLQ